MEYWKAAITLWNKHHVLHIVTSGTDDAVKCHRFKEVRNGNRCGPT